MIVKVNEILFRTIVNKPFGVIKSGNTQPFVRAIKHKYYAIVRILLTAVRLHHRLLFLDTLLANEIT